MIKFFKILFDFVKKSDFDLDPELPANSAKSDPYPKLLIKSDPDPKKICSDPTHCLKDSHCLHL